MSDILDELKKAADRGESVSLGDVTEAFGSRSYGPFLMLPALLEISPIGGIPGVPTVLAAIVVLFAGQMAFGREHLWLPGWIEKRAVSSQRVRKAADKVRPIGDWMDRWFHGRLPMLTSRPFELGAAIACILLALTVPPLEFLPFASTAPMAAIAAFGLALLVRDGLLMIVAYGMTVMAIGAGIGLWSSGR
ncbi:exopolysaccharide biosynthesis protein [Aureimonas mangrovi]|uniref:exopolysaccharide biosynthesis protein n=1 Tax=Aureimonas mangrovi TaxID=2758041 RepID=UPI001AEEBF81|nr:exopolysaccharide biosynthesis protein [Aureimonas mangrovi]